MSTVIKNERVIPTDIDDTLVMHGDPLEGEEAVYVRILDPVENRTLTIRVNKPMVRLVKEELHRGSFMLVWSRGGYRWAQSVIQALNLEHENMIIMSKPAAYFDDKPCEDWMPDRVYLPSNTPYKV